MSSRKCDDRIYGSLPDQPIGRLLIHVPDQDFQLLYLSDVQAYTPVMLTIPGTCPSLSPPPQVSGPGQSAWCRHLYGDNFDSDPGVGAPPFVGCWLPRRRKAGPRGALRDRGPAKPQEGSCLGLRNLS